MSKNLVIFGTGGFGREVMEAVYEQNLKTNEYNILGFIDDNVAVQGKEINFFPVVGTSEFLLQYTTEIHVLVCVGEPSIRQKIVAKLQNNPNVKFPNFICDTVKYYPRLITMGQGNIIFQNNVLSSNVVLGNHNHINLACTIGHDDVLGDFVTVSPGCNLSGNVTVGDGAYIGTGTSIKQGVNIGVNTTIGMGSVVTKDVPANVVAFGNPCMVQKQKNEDMRVFG